MATGIVEDLKSFANYGFPESHAWSFALIAYATGWLKAHYTAEFFAALLNSWPMGFYPPSTLIHDAKRHGVVVRPPCMKIGEWECTVEPIDEDIDAEVTTKDTKSTKNSEGVALRIGWRHIRGLGEKTLDALRLARGGKAAVGVGSSIGKSRGGRARMALTLEDLTPDDDRRARSSIHFYRRRRAARKAEARRRAASGARGSVRCVGARSPARRMGSVARGW